MKDPNQFKMIPDNEFISSVLSTYLGCFSLISYVMIVYLFTFPFNSLSFRPIPPPPHIAFSAQTNGMWREAALPSWYCPSKMWPAQTKPIPLLPSLQRDGCSPMTALLE